MLVVVVVLEVDEPVPEDGVVVVVLDVDSLGEVEPLGELMLPVLPDGLVLDDELLGGVELVVVSVVVDEDGGMAGVVVVVELVVELGEVDDGGVTTVVLSSLRSQPATPTARAMASALVMKIFDCMRNSFRSCGRE